MNGSLFASFMPLLILAFLAFLIIFGIKKWSEKQFRNQYGAGERQNRLEEEIAELRYKVEELENQLKEHIQLEKSEEQ